MQKSIYLYLWDWISDILGYLTLTPCADKSWYPDPLKNRDYKHNHSTSFQNYIFNSRTI